LRYRLRREARLEGTAVVLQHLRPFQPQSDAGLVVVRLLLRLLWLLWLWWGLLLLSLC
jgi:hypothetical protein